MARLARIVIPGAAHHVIQRGNRRQPVFFSDDDRRRYLALVREGCAAAGVRCLAWCLMDTHVHLVLVPETPDGLRAALGEAHRRYTLRSTSARAGAGTCSRGASPATDGRRTPDGRGSLCRAEPGRGADGAAGGGLALVERAQPPCRQTGARGSADRRRHARAARADWRAMLRFGLEAGERTAKAKRSPRRSTRGCAPVARSPPRNGSGAKRRRWPAGLHRRNGDRSRAPPRRTGV
jgi:putative transposase